MKRKKERPKILCFCYGVSEADIIKVIKEGATTLMEVRRKTQANTGCGGCGEDVKRLIRKHVRKQTPKQTSKQVSKDSGNSGDPADG